MVVPEEVGANLPCAYGADAAALLCSLLGGPYLPLQYEDIPGFCKSASLDEIKKHDFVLTPGRYVSAEEQEDDGEPFAIRWRA